MNFVREKSWELVQQGMRRRLAGEPWRHHNVVLGLPPCPPPPREGIDTGYSLSLFTRNSCGISGGREGWCMHTRTALSSNCAHFRKVKERTGELCWIWFQGWKSEWILSPSPRDKETLLCGGSRKLSLNLIVKLEKCLCSSVRIKERKREKLDKFQRMNQMVSKSNGRLKKKNRFE